MRRRSHTKCVWDSEYVPRAQALMPAAQPRPAPHPGSVNPRRGPRFPAGGSPGIQAMPQAGEAQPGRTTPAPVPSPLLWAGQAAALVRLFYWIDGKLSQWRGAGEGGRALKARIGRDLASRIGSQSGRRLVLPRYSVVLRSVLNALFGVYRTLSFLRSDPTSRYGPGLHRGHLG